MTIERSTAIPGGTKLTELENITDEFRACSRRTPAGIDERSIPFRLMPFSKQFEDLHRRLIDLQSVLNNPLNKLSSHKSQTIADKQFEMICIELDYVQERLDETSDTKDLQKMMALVKLATRIQQQMGQSSDLISELTEMRDSLVQGADPEVIEGYKELLYKIFIPELNVFFDHCAETTRRPHLTAILGTARNLVQEILALIGDEADYKSRIDNQTLAGLDLALPISTKKKATPDLERLSSVSEPLVDNSPAILAPPEKGGNGLHSLPEVASRASEGMPASEWRKIGYVLTLCLFLMYNYSFLIKLDT